MDGIEGVIAKYLKKTALSMVIIGAALSSGCANNPYVPRISVSEISSIGLNNDLERIKYIVDGNASIESANQNRLVRSLSSNAGKTYLNSSAYFQALGNKVKSNANFDKGLYGGGAALIDAAKLGVVYKIYNSFIQKPSSISTSKSGTPPSSPPVVVPPVVVPPVVVPPVVVPPVVVPPVVVPPVVVPPVVVQVIGAGGASGVGGAGFIP